MNEIAYNKVKILEITGISTYLNILYLVLCFGLFLFLFFFYNLFDLFRSYCLLVFKIILFVFGKYEADLLLSKRIFFTKYEHKYLSFIYYFQINLVWLKNKIVIQEPRLFHSTNSAFLNP
jgi:hypothetical protein